MYAQGPAYNNLGTTIGNPMFPNTTSSISNGHNTSAGGSSSWQTFSRMDYNLQHPSDWTVEPGISGEGIMLKPNDGSVLLEFGIHYISMSIPFSKELAFEKTRLKLTEFDNNTFISGHPAVKIVGIESSGRLQGYEVMILLSQFGGKRYHIDFNGTPQAYNRYLSTAQQIIDSFKTPG